jgi:ATP-dependent Clp protease ATP-binding subunit ClpA
MMKKSPCFNRLLAYAAFDCAQRGSKVINSDHLLLALYREDFLLIDQVMTMLDIDSFYPLGRLLKNNPESDEPCDIQSVFVGSEAREIIVLAGIEAQRYQHKLLMSTHVFMALLNSSRSFLHRFLSEKKIDPERARALVSEVRFDGEVPVETVELRRDDEIYLAIDYLDVEGFLPENIGISTLKVIKKL